MRTRRLRWARPACVALASTAMFGAVLAAIPSQAAPAPPDATSPASAEAAAPTMVTLVTGDRVAVHELAGGRTGVVVDSVDDRHAFSQYADAAGDLHVVPAAVIPMLGERLDPRLFNVSELVRSGYGGGGDRLPLIVTYTETPVAVPGAVVTRQLPSINGAALTVDQAGAEALGRALSAAGSADRLLAGVEKIWLDGRVTASLDESVPQIGAPAAWEAGFDGTGVTIGIVDTGIDDDHADLAGRVVAEEVFSGAPSPTDVFGHGTHVASIAAGSGAASDGQYTGVAFGAELVNAKVLDDFGSGFDSWVIAGMEWAAIDQDADIVNMSLNSGPSDGTDPVSQAVNTLSASEDALFVVSAGNFGYGQPETVAAPATADSALAVGAVDKSDVLANFSAIGPRLDGSGVKPEIVAPGVTITAARAAGAEIGPPVGEDYMELSGTSMASPHVAGAAALLLDANPDLGWSELKAVLVTSAADLGYTAHEEGGGRVDVAAALAQTVHSDAATIDLGGFDYPHDDGETSSAEVTLTNDGDVDVVIDLEAAAETAGEPAPAGVLTVEPATLDLAAGASGVVTVTADPQMVAIGVYGGALTASVDAADALHVPLAFEVEPDLADLTINVVELDGTADLFGTVFVQDANNVEQYQEFLPVFSGAQTVTVEVPPGTYSITAMSFQQPNESDLDIVTVAEPEIAVAGVTEVTLDSNDASIVEIDVGEDTTTVDATAGVYRKSEIDQYGLNASFGGSLLGETRVLAAETEPVTLGEFEFYSKWTLEGADTHYDLIFPEPDAVPAELSYEVGPDDVAQIENAFHADVEGREYPDGRHYFRPWSFASFISLYPTPAGVVRHDWVTADDTGWLQTLDLDGVNAFVTMQEKEITTYLPGEEVAQSWVEGPVRPRVPSGSAVRVDNTMLMYIPPWTDQENNVGYPAFAFEGESYDQFALELRADGEVVGDSTGPDGVFEVPAAAAEYELSFEASRDVEWWLHSTETSTLWRFGSEQPSGSDYEALPLLQVNYGIDLSLLNTADSPTPIRFDAYNLVEGPGLSGGYVQVDDGTGAIADFAASWSIDDGATWTELDLAELGNGAFEGTVAVPETCDPCFVSLRVTAEDDAGNGLEQVVTRAYTAQAGGAPGFSWDVLDTGSTGSFRGLDAVSTEVAWAASDSGEVLRTVDGGASFTDVAPPEGVADELLFRDVEARSADVALVLAVGNGEASRIYRTSDGGETWTERFRGDDPAAFFDCMAMFDRRHGIVMGDPVDGKFQILVTSDAGRTWTYAPADGMPDALDGEFGFAASGTCATATGRKAFFGTGGGAEARVFRSTDFGVTWDVSSTPIQSTEAGGIFSLDFRTNKLGIAIGGDFTLPEEATDALARTTDGGVTWELVDEAVAPSGYRSGLAWFADRRGDTRELITEDQKTAIAVGPSGSDSSFDRGKTWQPFDDGAFHSVECVKRTTTCWASGPDGRIATLNSG